MDDSFKTIAEKSEGIYREKGSRFLAYAFPVNSEDEISEIINIVKREHHSARHHCYAWRIGTETIITRANDDGEPSSTAGKPILGQLVRFDLTNTLIIVVRYFGGTLLGTGGLIRAYRSAAEDSINNTKIVTRLIKDFYSVTFSYPQMNDVMLIVKNENLEILETKFETECFLRFNVRRSESERVAAQFANIEGVLLKIEE